MIFTDRRADDYSNTILGADGNIRLGKSDIIKMQLMKSHSKYPKQIQNDFNQKAKLDDYAFLFNYRHDDNSWYWNARFTKYGDDFRADMGFINRTDFREYNFLGGHNWIFGPDSKFNRVSLEGNWGKSYDEVGNLLEEEFGIYVNAEGPMQSFL